MCFKELMPWLDSLDLLIPSTKWKQNMLFLLYNIVVICIVVKSGNKLHGLEIWNRLDPKRPLLLVCFSKLFLTFEKWLWSTDFVSKKQFWMIKEIYMQLLCVLDFLYKLLYFRDFLIQYKDVFWYFWNITFSSYSCL